MIAAATASGLDGRMDVADASIWEPRARFGLVFSNAALQWIPRTRPVSHGAMCGSGSPRAGCSPSKCPVTENRASTAPSLDRRRARSWRRPLRRPRPEYPLRVAGLLFRRAVSSRWIGGSLGEHLLASPGSRAALIDWYSGTGHAAMAPAPRRRRRKREPSRTRSSRPPGPGLFGPQPTAACSSPSAGFS